MGQCCMLARCQEAQGWSNCHKGPHTAGNDTEEESSIVELRFQATGSRTLLEEEEEF